MYTVVIIVLSFSLFVIVYRYLIRPWQLSWGSSKEEIESSLPGDDLVAGPDFNATRTIRIASSPELIWRWIIQIGSRRAGWYSVDWIDNAGVKSASEILLPLQHIEIGQFIPFTRNQKNGLWVKEFKDSDFIVWTDKKGKASWTWKLIPVGPGNTRLLTRLRTVYNWKGIWIIYYLLYDAGDIIMMSKCLKGIKKRAEKEYRTLLQKKPV